MLLFTQAINLTRPSSTSAWASVINSFTKCIDAMEPSA